jgi:glycosyltransferase involved in cell wall biosynthesis
MRILLVTPMPPRADGPGAIPLLLHAHVGALAKRHDVTLVTVFGDEPWEREAVGALRGAGVDIHAVDAGVDGRRARWRRRRRLASAWARRRYPWRTAWFAHPRVQLVVDELTSTRMFDVVDVEDNAMGVFRFPRGLPTVLGEYEVRPPTAVDRDPGPPSAWLSWVFRQEERRRWPLYEAWVWRRFDRVQVPTAEDAAAAVELAPDIAGRLSVNPFGVDVAAVNHGLEVPGTLLFTGNFTHPPNVDAAEFLVRGVMPRVLRSARDARLLLVGNAAATHVSRLTSAEVCVIDSPPTVTPYLEAAAVVVAPVRTGGGMRLKVIQALGAGKAVVTTGLGARGLAETEGEPPFVVADDVDAFAAATVRLLREGDLRRSLGLRALRFAVEHHSADAYARRLEGVYADTIATAGSRR